MDMRNTRMVDMTTESLSAVHDPWISHKLQCTADEIKQTACLNGGECFVLPEPNGYRKASCMCPNDWVGVRCEESYIDLTMLHRSSDTCISNINLTLLAGACIALFFLVIIMLIIIMKQRRRVAYDDRGKKQPLVHQISYSNYHGVRVIHDENTQSLPAHCVIPIPQEQGGFTTFINQGPQEANSDYGSHIGIDEVDTETESGNHGKKQVPSNNNNNKSKLDTKAT